MKADLTALNCHKLFKVMDIARSTLERYRKELGDWEFGRLVKQPKKKESSYGATLMPGAEETYLQHADNNGKPPWLRSENLSIMRDLGHYNSWNESYFSQLKEALKLIRGYRQALKEMGVKYTRPSIDTAADLSHTAAYTRIRGLWSGHGTPFQINRANGRKPGPGENEFFVSEAFSMRTKLFPEMKVDGMAPLDIREVESHEDGAYITARTSGFRQHLKRGVDKSFKSSFVYGFLAKDMNMGIHAFSELSREQALRTVKGRVIKSIDEKIKGGK